MSKELLLVDTNIISHALTPNQTPAYTALFKKLEAKYRFVVTGYTQYELLRSSNKTHRAKITEYTTHDMTCIELSDVLMNFAARIYYLYSKHPSLKGYKISTGDIINAALSIIQKCLVLTIDNNDHPTPFFREIDRVRITYQSKKDKEHTETAYILTPDMENIKTCFEKYEA